MEIITKDGQQYVSAREIHKKIGMIRSFSNWIKETTTRAMLEDGKDFIIYLGESTGGRPAIECLLTIPSAMLILMISKTSSKSLVIYKELADILGVNVVQVKRTRKELLFEIDLCEILSGITKIIPQYRVLNYMVDFYLPDINIVIEYDEASHKYYRNEDKRQSDIENYLQCQFIRVNAGQELIGLNKIYKVVLYSILFDLWQQNKLDDDQCGLLERLGEQIPKLFEFKKKADKMQLGNIIWDDTKENPLRLNEADVTDRKNNYNQVKFLLK
jgi:very-short-patch-repair endonuclease/phage anti-repressor protein